MLKKDNLRFEDNCSEKDLDFLHDKLEEYDEKCGSPKKIEFSYLVRNDSGKIVAGTYGTTFFGSVYIDTLWVHENFRGKGLGSKLVKKVEDFARKQGIKYITLDTMSFQAPGFYKKLGYEVESKRKNCEKDHSLLSLIKKL